MSSPAAAPVSPEAQLTQRLDGLNSRREALVHRKIRAQGDVERASADEQAARERAKREFGVETLEDAKKTLVTLRAENERKVTDYEASIADTEAKLAALEAGN